METITFIIIDNGVIAMSYQSEKIRKKIAWMNAEKTLKQLSNIELINFEDDDSQW